MANNPLKDVLNGQLPAEILDQLVTDVAAPTFKDTSGTAGDATANTETGLAAIATSATAAVITNSLVTANSVIAVTFANLDFGGAVRVKCVPANGSFTVTANASVTSNPLKFYWAIVK